MALHSEFRNLGAGTRKTRGERPPRNHQGQMKSWLPWQSRKDYICLMAGLLGNGGRTFAEADALARQVLKEAIKFAMPENPPAQDTPK